MKLPEKFVTALCLCVFVTIAFSQAPQAFDVTSIKENKAGADKGFSIPTATHGRFIAKNVSLMILITSVYRVQNVQVLDGPSWISSSRFDIDAKGPETAATLPEVYAMVRTMLADRFKLKIRNETKEMAAYALVVAKGGLKARKAEEGSCKQAATTGQPCPTNISTFTNGMAGNGVTMAQVATTLGRIPLDRYVIDKTGVTGKYDVAFLWKLEDAVPRDREERVNLDYEPPKSAFAALEEQAGLKLEPIKDKVPVLVIESVQMPDAN